MANGLSPNVLVGIEKSDNVGVENSGSTVVTVVPKNETPGGLEVGDVISVNWLFSIVTVVRPESKKALSPIFVTEFGIIILIKLLQLWNALVPIVVIWFPIVTLVTPFLPAQILSRIAPL